MELKEFRITVTNNIFIKAESLDDAHRKWQDINVEEYTDPDTNELLEVEMIDFEVVDVDTI